LLSFEVVGDPNLKEAPMIVIVVNAKVYAGRTRSEAWTKARQDQNDR